MANPANLDINQYFQSPEAFKPLQKKMKLIYQRCRLHKTVYQELELLKELVNMPLDQELFHKRKEDLFVTPGIAKVFEVAQYVLSQKAAPPPLPARPTGKIRPKSAEAITSVGVHPLKNEEAFQRLLRKATRGLARKERFQEWEISILAQIKSAGVMIAGNESFENAISRCLSETALEKAIKTEEIPPGATRAFLLEAFIKTLESQDLYDDDWKEALPEKPGIHMRSHTAHLFAASDCFLKELTNPDLFRKLVEGTVIMKYMFPGFYKKIFNNQLRKEIGDALLNAYLTEQLCGVKHSKVLENYFGSLDAENREEMGVLFAKLLSDQTLSDVTEPPVTPLKGSLPDLFSKWPFKELQSINGFIGEIGRIFYVHTLSYEHLYSAKEKQLMEQFLTIFLLMDFLHHTFEQALRYSIVHFPKNDFSSVNSLVVKIYPPAKDPVTRYVNGVFFFQHSLLFDYMIHYIEADLPNVKSQQAIKLAPILIGLSKRIKEDPTLTLEKGIASTFNVNTISRLCQTDNPDEIIHFLTIGLSHLMPKLQLCHKLLSSESWFNRLRRAAKMFKPESNTPEEWERVQARLLLMDKMEDEHSLTWEQLIHYYFNHEALRGLFNESDDAKNVQTAYAAFDAIDQQEAERLSSNQGSM